MKPPELITLTPGKRVLFLTKDPELIRKQLRGEVDLQMKELRVEDLLDDINTDVMTPAWVCFDYRPEEIARNAYAGLIVNGERVIPTDALSSGNFEVIVAGMRKGVGSSREQATQSEVFSGIRISVAGSFAPIHAGNNVNQGLLMADHDMLVRLQAGQGVPLREFYEKYDRITQLIIREGGLFPFSKAVERGELKLPVPHTPKRPMTMGEKILASHLIGVPDEKRYVKPGDAVVVEVDGGYSHEFTTAQVHDFLTQEYGPGYRIKNPQKFAVFEDHLIYADDVPRMRQFIPKIDVLRDMQRKFQEHTGCRDFSAKDNVSPGICHEVAREFIIDPGDFIQATDSHTCMGGVNNALAWGVGATEYANLVYSGFTAVEVSESIRFELTGRLQENVTAKDVMLYILANYAKRQMTLDRIIEFTGPGLRSLSPD
ncbi:MAG TPA: aconitase family protein, partial [Thermoanaerobaculia bacterium]|nr:aconitase family protein [Thermoanaerobaculia bacterium]